MNVKIVILVLFLLTNTTLVSAVYPPQPTKVYESFNPTTSNSFDSVYNGYMAYQTFTPTITHKVTKIGLLLSRNGLPGDVKLSIQNTNNGIPTGIDLTSGTRNCNDLDVWTYQWANFSLSPTILKENVKYAFVISDIAGTVENRPFFRYASWGGYSRGNMGIFSDVDKNWHPYSNSDIVFVEYGTDLKTTYVEKATKTNLVGSLYKCADGNWYTQAALPCWGGRIYEQFTVEPNEYGNYYMAIGDGYSRGQSYTPTQSHMLNSIALKARRIGTPGFMALRITATDSNGLPTGPILAYASFNANNLPVAPWPPQPLIIPISPPVYQKSGVKYCFYLESWDSYEDNVAEFVIWQDDYPGTHYTRGTSIVKPNYLGIWTNDPLDLYFKESCVSFNVGYSNYTIPPGAACNVKWYGKDVLGTYTYEIPQSSIDGSSWINFTMMYEPEGDGYMYTYQTKNTWMTAMPGAGGDRWSPINRFYEEKISYRK